MLDWFSKLDTPQKALVVVGLGAGGVFFLCCGCCGFLGLVGSGLSQQVTEEIAAADRLWDSGEQEQAVRKYKSVIDKNGTYVDDVRPYERIIDFEASRGNRSVASKYADMAVRKFLDVSPDSDAAVVIVEEARAGGEEGIVEERRFANIEQRRAEREESKPERMVGDRRQETDTLADWPTGITTSSGVKIGPYFSKGELTAIAGKIIQQGIGPGWELRRVIGVLGRPTKVSRFDGYLGMSPDAVKEFKDNPLIPPDVKAHMSKVRETCTWSCAEEPETHFILLGFEEGRLVETDGIMIRLP